MSDDADKTSGKHGNVLLFPGVESPHAGQRGDAVNVQEFLTKVPDDLQTFLVLGVTTEGKRYFLSTTADGPDMLWLLEDSKQIVLNLARKK